MPRSSADAPSASSAAATPASRYRQKNHDGSSRAFHSRLCGATMNPTSDSAAMPLPTARTCCAARRTDEPTAAMRTATLYEQHGDVWSREQLLAVVGELLPAHVVRVRQAASGTG